MLDHRDLGGRLRSLRDRVGDALALRAGVGELKGRRLAKRLSPSLEQRASAQAEVPSGDSFQGLWLDRAAYEIDRYVARLVRPPESYDLRRALLCWMQFGYLFLESAVEESLLDQYEADLEELLSERQRFAVFVNVEGDGLKPIHAHSAQALRNTHLRILDFHNNSTAGKRLMLHPTIVEFLGHVFRLPVVAMQSLTFLHGTEQPFHQDFAYVRSGIASHLAATWIPLETVREEAGPLGYLPGSHTLPSFDWGDGLFLTPGSSKNELDFADYLHRVSQEAGLVEKVVLARRGDLFFWHSGLVHRGTAVSVPGTSRRSFVTHYSTSVAYTIDRRAPTMHPEVETYSGGFVFRNSTNQRDENVFLRGGPPSPLVRLPLPS